MYKHDVKCSMLYHKFATTTYNMLPKKKKKNNQQNKAYILHACNSCFFFFGGKITFNSWCKGLLYLNDSKMQFDL